jgi:hypothetical protein
MEISDAPIIIIGLTGRPYDEAICVGYDAE